MEGNTIKSITPALCPHCQKNFFVEFEMRPTTLSDIYTEDQVSDAKAEVLKSIKSLTLDSLQKDNVVNWVVAKETVFGPNEVPLIIKSLMENNEK